jgi:hypothetical protein
MLHTQLRFIWPSGFRGEDFLEINQSEIKIACGGCLLTVLHTHFSPYSLPPSRKNEYILVFPPKKWVYTRFPPGKISIYSFFPPERSVYTHLSPGKISTCIYSSFPLIFRGEIWVYTDVSPSYSMLPLCTDRLYKGNNSYKGSTLWRLL